MHPAASLTSSDVPVGSNTTFEVPQPSGLEYTAPMTFPDIVSTATTHDRFEYHDTRVTTGTAPATYGSIAVVEAAGHCSNGRRVVVGAGVVGAGVVVVDGLVAVENETTVVDGAAVVDGGELVVLRTAVASVVVDGVAAS